MKTYTFVLICLVLFVSTTGKFVPACTERCDEDDFKRSHPPHIVEENLALEAVSNGVVMSRPIRIAFVFAGTPRSLILPPLHQSIRENLIASFCPIEYCISDVFVRVSQSDNTHGGLDSFGTLKQGDPSNIPSIKYAIDQLNPQSGEGTEGVTMVDWTDIGSTKEREEMLNSPFNSQVHKVLRTLDPRRYSMYFNRWSAYQMVLKKEISNGYNYTWIVHARLDTVWGEPVRAARDWSSEYVYTPDTWWSDVPDTFALLPRKWSDKFYDVETLSQPRAMCLGGPNFDPLVMEEPSLRSKGLDDNDIDLAKKLLCLEVFKGGPVTYQKHPSLGRIPWSDEGYSERILKRKLQVDKISLNHGTLIMHPFFLVLTRMPLTPMCNFLHPENHIGWIRTRQAVSTAQYFGCKFLFDELNILHKDDYKSCTGTRYDCILERKITDWNFLPFRIRYKALRAKLCLQMYYNGTLNFQPCVNYHTHPVTKNINISYYAPQLFSFFPLKSGAQKIKNYGVESTPNFRTSEKQTCLTVGAAIDSDGYRSLTMQPCNNANTQNFFVRSRSAQIDDIITSTNNTLPAASFMGISHTDRQNKEWCMIIKSTIRELKGHSPMELVLHDCKLNQSKKKSGGPMSSFKSEFFAEKTFSGGATYSPLFSMDKYKEVMTEKRKGDRDATAMEEVDQTSSSTGALGKQDHEVHAVIVPSSNEDGTGQGEGLKTDDGGSETAGKKRRRKGGKGKVKGKAKAKSRQGGGEASNSALLPQKKQGKKGGKIKWAIG